MNTQNPKIEVQFANPRDSRVFIAELDPACTGRQAIQGLLIGGEDGPFLEPAPPGRPYGLAVMRTGKQIPPNVSFAEAQVINGDVIEVLQSGQGA